MADDDIVENFLIFLLEMSIEFHIMFQYNIKFKFIATILANLKKKEKTKIEKATISQISTFHVYMLFWNRAFQRWPMKAETRTNLSCRGFWPCLLLGLKGLGIGGIFFSLFAQVLYNYFLNTLPRSSTWPPMQASVKDNTPMSSSNSDLTPRLSTSRLLWQITIDWAAYKQQKCIQQGTTA